MTGQSDPMVFCHRKLRPEAVSSVLSAAAFREARGCGRGAFTPFAPCSRAMYRKGVVISEDGRRNRVPDLWDQGAVDRFLLAIRSGLHVRGAAEFARIPYRRVREWIEKGRREDASDTLRTFAADYEHARGSVEVEMVSVWREAALAGDWRAAAAFLAKSRPDGWGDRVEVEHSGGISLADLHRMVKDGDS